MGCISSKEPQSKNRPQEGINVEIVRGLGRDEDREVQEKSKKALRSLLATKDRDFLVDGNGKKVKVDQLKGLCIALLFSAHAVPSAREFTKLLNGVYRELKAEAKGFEVIFFSNDESQDLWQRSLREMGWLALPFNEQETSDALGVKFDIRDIPTLVVLDSQGQLVTKDGVELLQTHGTRAWPFTPEKIRDLSLEKVKGSSAGQQTYFDGGNKHLGNGSVEQSL